MLPEADSVSDDLPVGQPLPFAEDRESGHQSLEDANDLVVDASDGGRHLPVVDLDPAGDVHTVEATGELDERRITSVSNIVADGGDARRDVGIDRFAQGDGMELAPIR